MNQDFDPRFLQIVQRLEALGIMPKTAPGLDKIKRALVKKDWYLKINPKKVIVVAGTNGKGSTCAILEALLHHAGKRVGFYSSPHLIKTTERIRLQGKQISESLFCDAFSANEALIKEFQLSHFESLTLIAADIFFSKKFTDELDFVILEVGLGGTFDATNAFDHHWSVITKLGLDHVDILGSTLKEIASNKFGIIRPHSVVVHHPLDESLRDLVRDVRDSTQSTWIPAKSGSKKQPDVRHGSEELEVFNTHWGPAQLSLIGSRAIENAMTALTLFEQLGLDPKKHLEALQNVSWPGRLQKVFLPKFGFSVLLSGDHNEQGIDSLIETLRDRYLDHEVSLESGPRIFHFIVGIGQDKKCEPMLEKLFGFDEGRSKIYLTETPFKGRKLENYPEKMRAAAAFSHQDINVILKLISESGRLKDSDVVIITGSLYLVGDVLKSLA